MLKETLLKSLRTATSDVLEMMFFQPAHIKEMAGSLEDWFFEDRSLYGARLGFEGPMSGICYLLISTNGIEEITANFLGINKTDVNEEQIKDTTKEALNMISGSMLSICDKTGAFKLGIPDFFDENDALSERLEDFNGDILLVQTEEVRMAVGLAIA